MHSVGAGDPGRSSSQADQHAALLLRRIVEATPQAAIEVHTPKSVMLAVLCVCFAAHQVRAWGRLVFSY